MAKGFGTRSRAGQRPAGQDFLPGQGSRDAASNHCEDLRLVTTLIKVSATELAEESPCARMRFNPRREDWRPRALLKGSNGILRARSDSSYEQA